METNVERIKHPDMVRTLAKSGQLILESLNHMDCHLMHMAIGISGEVDELTEVVSFRSDEVHNIKRESGDTYFYIEGLKQGIVDVMCSTDDAKENYERHNSTLTRQFRIPQNTSEAIFRANIEAGNILDLVKKKVIYRQELRDADLWQSMFQLRIYLENIHHAGYGITVEQCLDDNIEKLSARYKNLKYSDQQAKERNDEKV